MGIDFKLSPATGNNHPSAVRYQRRHLLQAFWIGVIVLFLLEAYTVKDVHFFSIIAAILIGITSLYPSYLWCSGKALGMPIFPLFALLHLSTHALPLVTHHPKVITYSPESHLYASITVASFLAIATFTWFQFVKSPPPYPKAYRALVEHKGDNFFLFILGAGAFFNMSDVGGWIDPTNKTLNLIKIALLGLAVLAAFVLSYRLGTKELSNSTTKLFLIILLLYMLSSGAALVLRGCIAIFLVSIAAFVLGRNQIPIITIIIVFACLSILQYGKGDMRSKYWFGDQSPFIQPWNYPAWYSEWFGYSFDYLKLDKQKNNTEEKSSAADRNSVIHMLLLVDQKSPNELPYLYGKTYLILPQLIIPRFLNPNKIRSHEGSYILSVHYGLQTEKQTYEFTIGWGLIAEAYANFGFLGCAGLGIVLGTIYGKSTLWSLNTPLLSARSLFNIILISTAAQPEWTAGVYFAALFQSSAVVVGITLVFMKTYRLKDFSKVHSESHFIFPEQQQF